MPPRFVLLGPPASGKGTQGRRLAEASGVHYLSTGALLREAVENGTELGRAVTPILERGGYVPDELMCQILADWLEAHPGGWVLDGFPRSVPQAQFLDQWLSGHQLGLTRVILLEAPFEDLLKRIQGRVECTACRWTGQIHEVSGTGSCPRCGGEISRRDDDSEENFRSRHAEFVRHTLPLVEYYEPGGLLVRCDATAGIEEVSSRIHGLCFAS